MRVLKNILISLGLIILAGFSGVIIDNYSSGNGGPKPADIVKGMVLITSVWAAFLSNKLKFRKYKTGMSYHPVVVFFATFFLWIVAFPWFLTIRDNILDGTAKDLDGFILNPIQTPKGHGIGKRGEVIY